MLLAFRLRDIVVVPFGWLLGQLYDLTANYGVAMILFAIIVQIVLMPINAKSKKSMMKMSRLTPRLQKLQEKYADDQQKQSEAIRALYKEEGVSMGGGCLWSFVPMLILFPLFTVIREPMTYILRETPEMIAEITRVIKDIAPDLFSSNAYYEQVIAAQAIPEFAAQLKEAIPSITAETLQGINFNFLGINLGAVPKFNIFSAEWSWTWPCIGAFLIPVMSTGSQLLQMWISQKLNNSVVTDEKGIQDEETAKKSQSNQTSKTMMWMMPLMTLWIGFTVSAGLSLYWLVGGVFRMVEDAIMTQRYRKIYDAEDAERLKRAMAEEAAEEERERVRAERRAANPEGQTQNTSKKKLQKQQKLAEDAEKITAKKEYDAKKGIVVEEEPVDTNCLSGIPSRPYCKGRAYDPNRYANDSTEE